MGNAQIDFDEPVPDAAHSVRDREILRRLTEVTPKEFERTLRRVEKYNPYAGELLTEAKKNRRRNKSRSKN